MLGSDGEEGRRQERRRQEAGEGNFILEMELEKEGLYGCIHTLKGQLFQIAWMWTATHVLCAANLEPGGHYQFCTGWNS